MGKLYIWNGCFRLSQSGLCAFEDVQILDQDNAEKTHEECAFEDVQVLR